VLARSGDRAGARALLDSTRAHLGRDGLTTDWLEQEAMVRLLLGERDVVLALLGDVVRRNPARRAWLAQVPWFATLHDDPAFRRLMGDAAR
jgi:hypothetical protein